jgi:hypothetical protein
MHPTDATGIVEGLQQRTATYAAAYPHLARRMLGKRPIVTASKTHAITVDLRSGRRTVTTATAENPFVRPSPIVMPALPIVVQRPTVFRPDGIRRILAVVAQHWDVGVPALLGAGRSHCLTRPRFAVMKLISERMALSMPTIGRALGNRDHTTILSGLRRAEYLHENDSDWRQRYDAALAELSSGAEQ